MAERDGFSASEFTLFPTRFLEKSVRDIIYNEMENDIRRKSWFNEARAQVIQHRQQQGELYDLTQQNEWRLDFTSEQQRRSKAHCTGAILPAKRTSGAASPCKGMGQWQLTSPAKGEFASKKMFGHVLGQFYGRSARGRPWPARFVHLTSRELTVQWWHMSWTSG
jgi:hypothetical protein